MMNLPVPAYRSVLLVWTLTLISSQIKGFLGSPMYNHPHYGGLPILDLSNLPPPLILHPSYPPDATPPIILLGSAQPVLNSGLGLPSTIPMTTSPLLHGAFSPNFQQLQSFDFQRFRSLLEHQQYPNHGYQQYPNHGYQQYPIHESRYPDQSQYYDHPPPQYSNYAPSQYSNYAPSQYSIYAPSQYSNSAQSDSRYYNHAQSNNPNHFQSQHYNSYQSPSPGYNSYPYQSSSNQYQQTNRYNGNRHGTGYYEGNWNSLNRNTGPASNSNKYAIPRPESSIERTSNWAGANSFNPKDKPSNSHNRGNAPVTAAPPTTVDRQDPAPANGGDLQFDTQASKIQSEQESLSADSRSNAPNSDEDVDEGPKSTAP